MICADSTNEENQIVTLINNFKTEVSTSDQCPTQSVITTPNTPGKLVFVFKLNFSKDQMLQILSSYGATVCVNKWKNNDWSFVCNVTVGTEDAVINRAKNDQNLDSVSKTAFK